MRRPPHPLQRHLDLLAHLCETSAPEPGAILSIDDRSLQARLGMSKRTLERAWEDMRREGVLFVDRLPKNGTTRTVTVRCDDNGSLHEWWAWAAFEAHLAATSGVAS